MSRNRILFLTAAFALPVAMPARVLGDTPGTATGRVFHDADADGRMGPDEEGLGGVRVSNGEQVVITGPDGRYELPVTDDTILFVVKPRGWRTAIDELNLPRFYYIHKPAGSPDKGFRYAGVDPTGPLPESVDFPLYPSPEADSFKVVFVGDPQPGTPEEIRYYANDIVAELVGVDAAFGMSMGDIVANVLRHFPDVNRVQAAVGVPWHNVFGNHDMNYDAPTNDLADETFERVYGPTSYVFQYARVHFFVLNNVHYNGVRYGDQGEVIDGGYSGRLSDRQLALVENYVATVPKDERIVVCTHIPLTASENRAKGTAETPRLLAILKNHPHSVSFSAHTHYMRTDELPLAPTDHPHPHTHESNTAPTHPHHNVVTGSGSWFRGPKDETGLPMTPMADGAPNGYLIAQFDGLAYSFRYKAARMPEEYQIAVHADPVIDPAATGSAEVLANVFAGGPRSTVRMRIRGSENWTPMEQVYRTWPPYVAMYERDQQVSGLDHRRMPEPKKTPHIWKANLPAELASGVHVVEIEARDRFGQTTRGRRLIQVGDTIGRFYKPPRD